MGTRAWAKAYLGDVAECRNGAGIQSKYFEDAGVPLVRISDFTYDSIDLSNCIFVNTSHAREWNDFVLSEGDVLVATVGSWPQNQSSVVGKVVRVSNQATGAIQNQNTACIIGSAGKVDQRFLFYLLRTEDFANYAAQSAHGSASQARLAVANLKRFSFWLPSIEEQRTIAHILGSLDDKIELNRRMNATLEATARAIFQSWFVDFDPVHAKARGEQPLGMDAEIAALFPDSFEDSELGAIPAGWGASRLSQLCEYIMSGGTPSTQNSDYWDGGIPWLSSGETREPFISTTENTITALGVEESSTRLAREWSIVIAGAGQGHTRGQTSLLMLDSYINQSVVALYADSSQTSNLYLFFDLRGRYEELRQISDSHSSRGSLTTKLLGGLNILNPPLEITSAFEQVIKPNVERIKCNMQQSQTLAETRDTLLPKLISGEVRVEGIEEQP